jgi:hypothetical protein
MRASRCSSVSGSSCSGAETKFLDRWDKDWAANNVSPKTRERFSQLIMHQVQPHLGNMPIQKLRAVHLNELYGKLLRAGRVGGGELSARLSVTFTAACAVHWVTLPNGD